MVPVINGAFFVFTKATKVQPLNLFSQKQSERKKML